MKKWMAAVGLVVLLLVGVMPAMVATAGIRDPILTGTSASMFFKTVNIEDKTIAGGESATFSVEVLQDNVLEAVESGTTILMGFKWDVKKNGKNYTNDNSYSDMFTVNTVIDNQFDAYASILTINAVEGNCILDGATVTLTMTTKNPSSGEAETITFTDEAKLTVSHTTGDWVLDEEASSGAIQVSNKTCTACGTVVDTKKEVVPLENPVYVGGEALQNAGASVTGGSGTATLHIAQDGSPVLVLDNYVYTGSGYEYESGKFAGIYYVGTGDFYLIPSTEASGIASTNSITVTAENATYSYGICLPSAKLHIGGSENGAADSLTVTGGPAKQYSAGIYVAGMYSYQSEQVQVITDPETLTEEPLNFGGNFTLNAAGGTVSGSNYTFSHGIWIKNETESVFSGGTINATGGQATANSGNSDYEGFSYGIRAGSGSSVLFNGATVTARGGNNSEAVEGSTTRTSYGCYFSEFELSVGSLTAIGGDITGTDSTTLRKSYGLYGTGSITGGTLTATGGNTIKGWSYGIESEGLSVSGNAVVTANSNGTTDTRKIGINISGNAGTMSVADNATVTASASDAGGIYAHYGLFMEGSSSTYTQTGGTVLLTAYSKDTGANNAGAYFSSGNKATISGGTFTGRATVKGIGATDLIINGGTVTGISEIHNDIKPAADATSYGINAYSLVLTDGELIGTGSDSYDYMWTTGIRIGYQSTISGGTVTGTGGNVYVGDSGYNSIQSVGVEFVALNMSAGTVIGNAGAVDKPQSNYSRGVKITGSSTVSGTAKINGTGLTGVYISTETLSMPEEGNSAVINGSSNASDNGTGLQFVYSSGEIVLEGGSINAVAPETGSNNIGLKCTTLTTDGTRITAKGGAKAVAGNLAGDVVVASAQYSGEGKKALSVGLHEAEELAAYKYAEAGDRTELGYDPTARDIAGAVIVLGEKLVYNRTEQTQSFTVHLAGVDLIEGGYVTVSGHKATDVGTYTLTLTAKPDTDYTGTATMEYTVSRWNISGEVTVTVTGGPYAYLSTVDPAAFIVKHGDVVLELNKDYTVDVHTSSVGENGGSVYVYSMAGSNYVWQNGQVKANFTVVRAENPVEITTPLTVIRGGNWVGLDYSNNKGGTSSFSFEGADLGCTIENGALYSGDTVGTVTVKAVFAASDYYNETVKTFTVTITEKNRAELDWVTLKDADYQYNDATILAQVYHSGSGSRVKEDIIEYSGTTRSGATYARSTTPPTQAGNYTVHVTYETKDTIYTGSDDFVINPKYIASNITVTLGEALTYNGTEQTQTVTEVCDKTAGYNFSAAEYTITGNKQTNAGYYSLDITGIGNFTGTKTVSYEIAKATPTLGDFEIPAYDDTVDYTGEYIEITPPTSTKNGMGNTYIETYVRNAGTYNITFKVYEGTNYTAASGFTYGTITVNKVEHDISATDAIVGINGKTISLYDRVAGDKVGATFSIVAGSELGCTINGSTLISGSMAGDVTVKVTVPGNDNYLETTRTFTVTVVEEGGVKVWGYVTSFGNSNDKTIIQLLQDDVVKYEVTKVGNSPIYSFDGVAADTYILQVTKTDHLLCEREIIVASEDLHEDVDGTNHQDEYTYSVNASDHTKHDKYLACCDKVVATEDHTPEYVPEGATIKVVCEFCEEELGTVTISRPGGTYNGSAYQASVTGTGSLEAEASELTVSYSRKNGASWDALDGAPVDAGTYKASVTLGEESSAVTVEAEFTIAPKELTVTGATANNKVYDGLESVTVTGVTLSGIVGEDAVRVDTTGLLGYFPGADAGTYRGIILPNLTLTGEKAGNYTLIQPDDAVATSVTIEQAPTAPNLPEATRTVAFEVKTVAAVTLPTGWVWAEGEASKALTAEVPVAATAVYNGADKGNYVTETILITITRTACVHAGETELRDVVEVTCTAAGYTGDTYCLDCGNKIASGTVVENPGHKDDNGDYVCDACSTALPTPTPTVTPTPKPTATPTPTAKPTATPKPTAIPTPPPASRAEIEACLYNGEYYALANEDVAVALDYDPDKLYEHWVNFGKAEGRSASLVFHAAYYLEVNPDVAAVVGNDYAAAYEHFVTSGLEEGRESSPVFDVKYYLRANADVAEAFAYNYVKAANHFNTNALAEGRSGSGNFDYTVYRYCNTDVAELYGDEIRGYYIHYINHGRAEGRTAGFGSREEVVIDTNAVSYRIFDKDYYLENYTALARTVGTTEAALYRYWISEGIELGHVASPVFDPAEYLRINTDVAEVLGNDLTAATNHFLNYGIYEGRTGVPEFDYTVYKYCNTDVVEVFGDDIVGYYFHYVKYGRAEGRTARIE